MLKSNALPRPCYLSTGCLRYEELNYFVKNSMLICEQGENTQWSFGCVLVSQMR